MRTKNEPNTFNHLSIDNISLNLCLRLGTYFFSAASIFFATRALQPERLGKVAFASSLVSYFALLANMGMPIYAMRRCAECRDKRKELSRTVLELFVLNLILSAISFSILVGCCLQIPIFKNEKLLFLILGSGIIWNALGCEWLYKALEQYRYMVGQTFLFKALALIGTILFIQNPEDYLLYAALTVVASSGIHICYFMRLSRYVDLAEAVKGNGSDAIRLAGLRKHFRPVFLFFLMSCAVSIYGNLDLVMLGFLKDNRDVGLYSLVSKTKGLLASIGGIIWTAVLPSASACWKAGNKEHFAETARESLSIILFLQIPTTVYFFLFCPEAIAVLGGAAYAEASTSFRIMVLAIVPIGLSNILGGQILIPAGLEKNLFAAEVLGMFLNFSLNLLVIPRYSLNGAAATTVFAEIVVWLYCRRFIRKNLKLSPCRISHIVAVSAGTLIAVTISFVFKKIEISPVLKLTASAATFALVYIFAAGLFKEPHARAILRAAKKECLSIAYRIQSTLLTEGAPGAACPCCGNKFRRFVDGGYQKHPSIYNLERYGTIDQRVICPLCRSLPRHRILTYWLEQNLHTIQRKKILHFAAEPSLSRWFRQKRIAVITADLHNTADLRLNIEATGLTDGWAEMIICNHVLEHVDDHKKALKELWRILRDDGFLIISFPIDSAFPALYEDRNITSPEERLRAFGQNDHLRIFGRDAKEMLEHFSFSVEEIKGQDMPGEIKPIVGPADYDSNILYLCTKQRRPT